MSKRATSPRPGLRHRRRGVVVVTGALDPGHDLRVVSRAAARPGADRPGAGRGAEGRAAGTQPPAATAYEVPRSGWPVPARPLSPVSADGGRDARNDGRAEARPARAEDRSAAAPKSDDRPAKADPTPRAPSHDDVEADIAAIVAEGRRSPGQGPRERANPADDAGAGVPPGPNRQAIFDQIAASMARARSYDLGSVELERRFDEFDRAQDAVPSGPGPRRPSATGTRRPLVAPGPRPGGPAPAAAATATEVLEDLDAIRSRAQADEIPLDPGVGGRSIGVDALEPGDIILSTTGEPLSEQIRAVTGSEVSHAAVYVGDGRLVESIEGGVVLRSVGTAVADDTLAVAYRHRDMTPARAARMVPFLEDHARERTPYDRWGLVQVAPGQLARAICNRLDGAARQACLAGAGRLRVGTNDDDTFFCSELVLEAFKLAGLSMSTLEPSWSSPGQIADLRFDGLLDYVGHLKA